MEKLRVLKNTKFHISYSVSPTNLISKNGGQIGGWKNPFYWI